MNAIGVMLNNLERDRLRAFEVARRHGFQVVHTSALPEAWLRGPERAHYIDAARASGLHIHSMFVGFDGQSYADMASIRCTVGLVIPELRDHRVQVAKDYADLARDLGVTSLSGHLGFLPPADHADYQALVTAFREVLDYCAVRQQNWHLETGQDSAADLLRFMTVVDRRNLAINFDPANFILYDSDNPHRAFDALAPYVRGFHCKDAVHSSKPGELGMEVPLGKGQVDLPRLFPRLRQIAYTGPLIIERESGSDPVGDILWGREYLQTIFGAE